MVEKEQGKFRAKNLLIYMIGQKRAIIYGVFSFVMVVFMYGAMLMVIWYGSKLNLDGHLTIGKITSYLFYCIQILVNFSIFTTLIATLMQISGASEKIIEMIDHKPLIKSRGGLKPDADTGG